MWEQPKKGIYTIMLSNNYKKIIAVELDPIRSAHLSHNIVMNRITYVDICQERLSDKEGFFTNKTYGISYHIEGSL
jgi:predicted RNA methylase